MNNSRLAKRELDNSSKNAAIDPRHFTEAQRQEIVESLAMKLGPEFMSHRSGPGGQTHIFRGLEINQPCQ
ncbi:DNA repair protein rad52 [Batrachochytrium dendrobatidis]|nr:DNA repair protein rad52 [Batrachochytrium dendrobatidis]